MAEILQFPKTERLSRRHRKGDTASEVIIFPGVRIERQSFSLADRVAVSRPKRVTGSQAAKDE